MNVHFFRALSGSMLVLQNCLVGGDKLLISFYNANIS